jgi:hypothetical protein
MVNDFTAVLTTSADEDKPLASSSQIQDTSGSTGEVEL